MKPKRTNETEFANQEPEATEAVRPVADDWRTPQDDGTSLWYGWKNLAFDELEIALSETKSRMDRLKRHVDFEADNETIMCAMHALEGSLHTVERMLGNLMGLCPQLMRDEDKEKKK